MRRVLGRFNDKMILELDKASKRNILQDLGWIRKKAISQRS